MSIVNKQTQLKGTFFNTIVSTEFSNFLFGKVPLRKYCSD